MAIIDVVNRSAVPDEALDRIVSSASLPDGRIRVLVGATHMVDGSNLGEAVPRNVLDCAVGNELRSRIHREAEWDCGIALSRHCCNYHESHPGFFALVLGHELGHAALALTDPAVHAYATFIQQHQYIEPDHTFVRAHELPHERRFEQYGMAVAEAVYGRRAVVRDIEKLLSDGARVDHDALRALLDLSPTQDLTGVKDEIREFGQRHLDHYVARWLELEQIRHETSNPFLGDFVPPIEDFLRPSG